MKIAIEFSLNKKDLLLSCWNRTVAFWKVFVLIDLVTTFLVLKTLEGAEEWSLERRAPVVAICFSLMLLFLFAIIFLKALYIQFVSNRKLVPRLLAPHKFIATDEMVCFQVDGIESKIRWEEFLKISSDRRFLLFWPNSVSVQIIPWRFFSMEERNVISAFIKGRRL